MTVTAKISTFGHLLVFVAQTQYTGSIPMKAAVIYQHE